MDEQYVKDGDPSFSFFKTMQSMDDSNRPSKCVEVCRQLEHELGIPNAHVVFLQQTTSGPYNDPLTDVMTLALCKRAMDAADDFYRTMSPLTSDERIIAERRIRSLHI